MSRSGSGFAPAHLVEHIEAAALEGVRSGVLMQQAADVEYTGRRVTVGTDALLNFGACSYLGLELRDELKEGAIDAIRRYGTQFSISRLYMESPLFARVENALNRITGGHTLVTASTSLGHIAALPLLVRPTDAVLIDQFAHASVHTAVALLKNVTVEPVRHNRIDLLESKIARLAAKYDRVWYLCDGVYSMHGDFAPLARVAPLLEKYPTLHLYVDDAHAMSWAGRNGKGYALSVLPDTSRTVVALSLNKAFSAAGGALVFPNAKMRESVRVCGGPMIFSGPVQPPMLGAALASAELHLSPGFESLQRGLQSRIALVHRLAEEENVPLANTDATPIFFVRCGTDTAAYSVARGLRARGVYACASVFPAVPKNQAGLRFTVSLHNTEDDIRYLMRQLAELVQPLPVVLPKVRAPMPSQPEMVVRPSQMPPPPTLHA